MFLNPVLSLDQLGKLFAAEYSAKVPKETKKDWLFLRLLQERLSAPEAKVSERFFEGRHELIKFAKWRTLRRSIRML